MVSHNEDVEDIIVQGLANKERRNILKVIKLAEDGAIYSNILDELELNSGLLNYHLRQLEGLISKNAYGRYLLTPLGEKALIVLYSMTENLENGYEKYVAKAKTRQKFAVYPSIAGVLAIIVSCVTFVLGIIGFVMSVSLFDSGGYGDLFLVWSLITWFSFFGFLFGLFAGIFLLRRKRFKFSLIGLSLLLIPNITSLFVFLATNKVDGTGTGWIFALFMSLPLVVSLILSIVLVLLSKNEFN